MVEALRQAGGGGVLLEEREGLPQDIRRGGVALVRLVGNAIRAWRRLPALADRIVDRHLRERRGVGRKTCVRSEFRKPGVQPPETIWREVGIGEDFSQ